jgi:hypothetical protein
MDHKPYRKNGDSKGPPRIGLKGSRYNLRARKVLEGPKKEGRELRVVEP